MTAYYNEIEPYAAEWLRNLIAAGHIAPGVVDTRSIEDVHPTDLKDFTQCHFFAGIGVWSLALRRAGWPDDRPVWTGSCPCQPFSAAGQGAGFADERHLWPAFGHLIAQCKPPVVIGEQVASKDVDVWIDLVHADLEALGYAFGSVPFPSAGIGAPHIRDRNYWVANAQLQQRPRRQRAISAEHDARGWQQSAAALAGLRLAGGLGDPSGPAGKWNAGSIPGAQAEVDREGCADGGLAVGPEHAGAGLLRLGHAGSTGLDERERERERGILGGATGAVKGEASFGAGVHADPGQPGPTNGYWRDADWLGCRDGKWRPVEASPQPLVDGSAESLGRVRPEVITQIEEEVNAATAQTEGGRAAAMRALLEVLGAQAKCGWPAGGIPGLHEAPFLLAFVRQLQEQGWRIAEGVALPRAEATSGVLRSVWHDQATAGAPRRRELDEQRSGEPADVVCVLSRILARHASAAWDDAYAAHAEIGFPIGHGSRSRVGRLRGYGNAINAEAARVFIEAVMEAA